MHRCSLRLPQRPMRLHRQRMASPACPASGIPNRRFRKPVSERTKAIRFLTELDSPPLSFTGPDGGTAGFNVELARAICMKLEAQCTIQELKWDLLMKGISREPR
jgi:polar amino acid transport system substrate-binding protein